MVEWTGTKPGAGTVCAFQLVDVWWLGSLNSVPAFPGPVSSGSCARVNGAVSDYEDAGQIVLQASPGGQVSPPHAPSTPQLGQRSVKPLCLVSSSGSPEALLRSEGCRPAFLPHPLAPTVMGLPANLVRERKWPLLSLSIISSPRFGPYCLFP